LSIPLSIKDKSFIKGDFRSMNKKEKKYIKKLIRKEIKKALFSDAYKGTYKNLSALMLQAEDTLTQMRIQHHKVDLGQGRPFT
jgi:hypothetical protein